MAKTKKEKHKDNIVVFPRLKHDVPPQTVEELKKKITASRMEIAEVLAEEMTKENVRIMIDNGYHINHTKDIAFLMTTIKSILLRYDQIEYPIQDLIDDNFNFLEETETETED
jgi:hypothetical protein